MKYLDFRHPVLWLCLAAINTIVGVMLSDALILNGALICSGTSAILMAIRRKDTP